MLGSWPFGLCAFISSFHNAGKRWLGNFCNIAESVKLRVPLVFASVMLGPLGAGNVTLGTAHWFSPTATSLGFSVGNLDQDPEKKAKSLTAEINNGRLAMMAIIGTSQVRLSSTERDFLEIFWENFGSGLCKSQAPCA